MVTFQLLWKPERICRGFIPYVKNKQKKHVAHFINSLCYNVACVLHKQCSLNLFALQLESRIHLIVLVENDEVNAVNY